MFSLVTKNLLLTAYDRRDFKTFLLPTKSNMLSLVNELCVVFCLVVGKLIGLRDFDQIKCYKRKNSNDTAATYQVFVNYMLIKFVCNEDGILWKRPPLKWQPLFGSYSNLKLKIRWLNFIVQILKIKTRSNGRRPPMEDNLQWKTTSIGRSPQNMKIWISQQPLIESSSNFKHKLMGPNQSQERFQWRWPLMEDDLIWKMT